MRPNLTDPFKMLPCTRNLQEQTIGCWLCQGKKKHFPTLKTDTFNTPNLPLECPLGRSRWVAQRCVGSPTFEWCYEQGCWSNHKLLCDGSNLMSSCFQLCTVSKLHDEFNTRLFLYTANHCFLNFDFPFFAFYQLVPIFFDLLPPSRRSYCGNISL